MNIYDLRVYESPFPKKRIGNNFDGGYVIAHLPDPNSYDFLLGGGILDDVSFEIDFLKHYPIIQSNNLLYDGSIDGLPPASKYMNMNEDIDSIMDHPYMNLQFRKQYLTDHMNEEYYRIFDQYDNIFVKMDIEGGEYALFSEKAMSDEQIQKIKQITIELHSPHHNNTYWNIIKRFNKYHTLIHVHGNNCCSVDHFQNNIFPSIIELTYLRNNLFSEPPKLTYERFPTVYDQPNLANRSDISFPLNWPL
jgi:hypothetical protein